MRVLLDGTLEAASDDHRNAPEPERTLAQVRRRLHHRHARQAGLVGLVAALAVGTVWLRPGLDTDGPQARPPRPPASQASPYPRVPDNLDFASDGSFDIPLAVVRSRCEMTVDEHVRPVTQESVWDAPTVPGGSDLTIQNDAGFTRHCLVGYNRAARKAFVVWETLTPMAAAKECADQVGLDLTRWGAPNAALLVTPNDFSAPSVVVALRREPGLLAECYLVKNLPAARLTVSRLESNRPALCAGISLYLSTTENSHRLADGVVAWGVAPVRDKGGRLLEEAAFMIFTGSGLPTVAVPVAQGVVAANVSWPLPVVTSLADAHPSSRLVTDYTVAVIDDGGRTLASEKCG